MSDLRWSSAAGAVARMLGVMLLLCARASAQNQIICPRADTFDTSVNIDSYDPIMRFSEISGIAVSTQYVSDVGNPVLYGMSDIGGGKPRLGVWDSVTGARLVSLEIPEPNNDWESMSLGSCGNANGTCIYIADTGDNEARTTVGETSQRSQAYRILKIKEPNWKMYTDNSMLPSYEVEILEFDYLDPSSPTLVADSESMFLDHTGWGEGKSIGDIYVITKWDNVARYTYPRVFYIPLSAWGTGVTYSPEAISNGTALLGGRWTRADMTYDGKLIAVGDINVTHIYTRCPGVSVDEALKGAQPCYTWNNPVLGQMESFAWSPDGTKNIQISEGSKQPMGWTTMSYDPANTVSCPDFIRDATVPTMSPGVANGIPGTPIPTTTPNGTNGKNGTQSTFPFPSVSPIGVSLSDTPTFSMAPMASPETTFTGLVTLRPVTAQDNTPSSIVSSTSVSPSKLALLDIILVAGMVSSAVLLIA